ncbi:universal stress protein [Halodesulfovibrio marinisediminis]|uniref:Universal stress protein n=1 Tax=Halodesulfovibrio marinisediminis DSM 17456 TaxID=1121457 RepID=A0A1N6ID28_9BACT|nr:universal stress protein [Halodesulfovibrio marinisediminis]SIO29948.1 Nucleotide-binding universal stress protein, UspA family [Halodesulfovibrio marinisediminis DSM 17456]
MVAIKKALVAIDFSDESTYIAEYAQLFAEKFDAELIVVYAAPSLNQYVGFHVPPNTIEAFVGEIVTGAEKNMDEYLEKHFPGLKVKGKVVTGFAAEEILEIAADEKADLVIMGTHGRTGIDRLLFGSVAAKVVRGAEIPVLTVRPDFPK